MADKKKPTDKKPAAEKKPPLSLGDFFGRYHAIIFTLGVGGGLSVAIFMLYSTIGNVGAPLDYTPSSADTSFDEATIERVRQLRPLTEQPTSPDFGPGRTNPFP